MSTNREAVDKTLAELERVGRLEAIDAARIQAVRSIADALDDRPYNSQMWREYRETLKELLTDDGAGDVDRLIAELSSPVRDASTP